MEMCTWVLYIWDAGGGEWLLLKGTVNYWLTGSIYADIWNDTWVDTYSGKSFFFFFFGILMVLLSPLWLSIDFF